MSAEHRKWHARGVEVMAAQMRKTRLEWQARAWRVGYKDGEPEVSEALQGCEDLLRAAAEKLRAADA